MIQQPQQQSQQPQPQSQPNKTEYPSKTIENSNYYVSMSVVGREH